MLRGVRQVFPKPGNEKCQDLPRTLPRARAHPKHSWRAHALQSAVPMIGFGVVDCVVMTQVGSTMDAVLGARLGISSITAAAIGLFCSDSCGVLFGGTIESFAGRLGLPTANLTSEQLEMPETKRVATLGRLFGVQLGVLLGSTTLLLQGGGDTDKNVAQETASADSPLAFGRYSCDHDGGRCCCIFQTWLPVL